MKILSLESTNKHTNLKINKIDFQNLSLLVGASGVGKTQILKNLINLKMIASGKQVSGFEWDVAFEINNDVYQWRGDFEKSSTYNEEFAQFIPYTADKESRPKILKEILSKNGIEIISRSDEAIIFNSRPTVKLAQSESVINLLREEEDVEVIFNSFKNIEYINPNVNSGWHLIADSIEGDEFKSLEGIRNSSVSILAKLYLCQEYVEEYFHEIVETFKDIFPFIEDVRLKMIKPEFSGSSNHKFFNAKFKEKGVESWIDNSSMSSGMSKTLTQLAYLHLSQKGSVLLIDEFENGFGVNCINDITSELVNSSSVYGNDIQFIITSHHPYIINNISIDYWKIISRKAGLVTAYSAKDFGLHDSNHQAFTKLINLSVYADGANL